MLFAKNLTKSFGAQVLLENADFQLNRGEKIGIVGRNGYGKSTLFRLILGNDEPDEGEISYPEDYRIGALDQHLSFDHETVRAEVAQVLPEHHQYDVWKAEKILSGLGFSPEDFEKNPRIFSGGFQIRIKLAQLLLSAPDLLLLDEPTNYLDILSIRWLENFLKNWKGEILCVSHDQTFLKNVMTHTVAIHRKNLKKIKGDPQKVYDQIAYEEDIHEKTRKNDAKERARQEKFIREFRSGARSAGLVQSRVKMLAKKETLNVLAPIPPIKFNFPERDFSGAKMIEGHNVCFGYEAGQELLKKVTFELFPGDKIGIIGANGKGKSTLLKLLNQELTHQSGTLKFNQNLHVGYFGQSNVDKLDKTRNIVEELTMVGDVSEQSVRSIAGSLLFSGDLAYKKISVLSGGEKARVNLGKILLTPSNLLLLDEPTNHLDYESVEALMRAVKKFSGSVVFVSHDENFLRNVAEKLIVFDGDEVFVFSGNYERFLAEKGFQSEALDDVSVLDKHETKKEKPVHRERTKEKNRLLRPLKKELSKIEKKITDVETLQEENTEKFKIADRQGNRLKMETLGIEYQALQKKVEAYWAEWEKVGQEIEVLVAEYEE